MRNSVLKKERFLNLPLIFFWFWEMLQLPYGWFVDHDSGKTIGSVSMLF